MLQKALKAETLKLKHSPIWLAFMIIPVISAIMGTFNYWGNRDMLKQGWHSLWTQHTIFYCYFCFPALVAVYCSYICRLEHMNGNWKSILAEPIHIGTICVAKWLTVMKILVLTQIFVGILFLVCGKIIGFNLGLPKELVGWLSLGLVAGGAIAAFQLMLSLIIRSFAIPIGVGLLGGIVGLRMRAAGFGLYCPYSLFAIGMRSNNPEANLECSLISFIGMCFFFIVCFIIWGIRKMKTSMI